MTLGPADPDARRLKDLWAGEFGDDYIERNLEAGRGREPFWSGLLGRQGFGDVLEVGCNIGVNLRWIRKYREGALLAGVDVNHKALRALGRETWAYPVQAEATALPFADGSFDLVFTTGVLIHQAPASLPRVMAEIVRCSRSFVLCGEYASNDPVEVPYRGVRGALFKRDFGSLYAESFPGLTLVEEGFLGRDEGWDDVTYWLFRKPGSG